MPTSKPERLISLDAFRGLTILAMILVNNPGTWSDRFAPLAHAKWHGWTLTDLVFPFFLFIMGTAMAFSLSKYRDADHVEMSVYRRIFRRTLLLISLGLFLNLSKTGVGWLFGYGDGLHLDVLRFTGVLQRIALVFLGTSLIVIKSGLRTQVIIAATFLLGYWAMLAWLPNPSDFQANLSPEGNVGRIVDVAVIGAQHMRDQARHYPSDATGLLATLPSIVSALLGYWAGLLIRLRLPHTKTITWLVSAGIGLTLLGLAWGYVLPINKTLWTSSYVALSGGLALVALAMFFWLFDVAGWRRFAKPLEIVGVNAIFAYVGAEFVSILLGTFQIQGTSVKSWLYTNVLANNLADPRIASLGYAVAIVAFWWLILWAMARRGWSIRV